MHDQNTVCGIWVIPHVITCWKRDEGKAIIIFTLILIVWHDMTFVDPEMYVPWVQVILQHQYLW